MGKSERIFKELKSSRLVALLTPGSVEECAAAYKTFQSEGLLLEIALRSDYGIEGIQKILAENPDALVLAGTVLTAKQAQAAIAAGAAGIVSADYIPEVVDICVEKDIMCVPGGLSDAGKQLVHKAEAYGCSLEELKERFPYQWVYKLFPAFSGVHSHMELAEAWRGPFKDLTVIYTGGVTLANLGRAAQKDPLGIFCSSALAKAVGDPDTARSSIRRWKERLNGEAVRPVPLATESDEKKRSAKVVTFGEMLMRLSPPVGIRLASARNFELFFGGAEANVAVGLAQFGQEAIYVTALPENDLGENALRTLKAFGVDTRHIVRKGSKFGSYYLEHGAGPRPSRVVYDRAFSAMTELQPEDLDWDRILDGAHWFHWTGITPALGDSVASLLREGLEEAKRKGITISCDLNYRKNLWSPEKAKNVMTDLVSYVDVLFGNEEDSQSVFGIHPGKSDVRAANLDLDGYRDLTRELVRLFDLQKAAITLRESVSASENYWSACLFDGQDFFSSRRYHVNIIDRVGAGDAFASGLIAGWIEGKSEQETLEFGVAAACLKHSIRGDFNLISAEEAERLAAGDTSGRVVR
jgi:2-dehydro-3-deoxygluconokinase